MNGTPDLIIGIDQATACGYAVLNADGGRIVSGVWDLSPRRGEGDGFRYVRFVGLFRKLLESVGAEEGNAVVAYERPVAFGHSQARSVDQVGPALVGHILYQTEVRKIPYTAIAIATAKAAAGSGKFSKLQMIDAANQKWRLKLGYVVSHAFDKNGRPKPPKFPGGSDNEADALWIAEAARRQALAL